MFYSHWYSLISVGSHCLDILKANETDPEWLVTQRKTEVGIIKEWISKYYADLGKYKQ